MPLEWEHQPKQEENEMTPDRRRAITGETLTNVIFPFYVWWHFNPVLAFSVKFLFSVGVVVYISAPCHSPWIRCPTFFADITGVHNSTFSLPRSEVMIPSVASGPFVESNPGGGKRVPFCLVGDVITISGWGLACAFGHYVCRLVHAELLIISTFSVCLCRPPKQYQNLVYF